MACAIPQKCAPRYRTLLRLYLCVPLAACIAWLTLALVYLSPLDRLISGAFTAALILCVVFLPGMYYERLYYTRYPRWLKLERGLILRTIILVPRGQIICTRLRRGPLERIFGLSTVIFVTTAGRVTLSGLTREDSARLRELVDRGGETIDPQDPHHIAEEV